MLNEVEELLNELIDKIIIKCKTNNIKASSESHVKKKPVDLEKKK